MARRAIFLVGCNFVSSISPAADRLILGAVQIGLPYGINNPGAMPSEAEALDILHFAEMKGISRVDTADGYGVSQARIGKHIALGGALKVFTKFTFKNGERSISERLTRTLGELGLERVEGYSFHQFGDFLDFSNTRELEGLRSKVRYFGVSIYTEEQLEAAIATDWVQLIQLPFNLLDTSPRKRELLARAKEAKIELHARSVYLQGLFFRKSTNLPAKLKALEAPLARLECIAAAQQLSVGELALLYAVSKCDLDGILVGVDSPAQIEAALSTLNRGELAPSLVKEIESIEVDDRRLLSPANWA